MTMHLRVLNDDMAFFASRAHGFCPTINVRCFSTRFTMSLLSRILPMPTFTETFVIRGTAKRDAYLNSFCIRGATSVLYCSCNVFIIKIMFRFCIFYKRDFFGLMLVLLNSQCALR